MLPHVAAFHTQAYVRCSNKLFIAQATMLPMRNITFIRMCLANSHHSVMSDVWIFVQSSNLKFNLSITACFKQYSHQVFNCFISVLTVIQLVSVIRVTQWQKTKL